MHNDKLSQLEGNIHSFVTLINEKIFGALGVATDITEKKKTEETLVKTQGQLEGMKIVSATIAHELRTPLATIKNGLMGIQQLLPNLITSYSTAHNKHLDIPTIHPTQLNLLSTVLNRLPHKVDESNRIMNMLLTNISGYTNGKIALMRCSAIRCVRKALAKYPFPTGFQDKVTFRSKKDFKFYGQALLIIHVLFNLLKNAFYFIQKMHKGDIHIWLAHDKKYNSIHFKDTAQGIKLEHLPYIFKPFYARDTNKGTGIGLAFCQTVMASCNGSILCESVYGQYSEFILQFPTIKYKNKEGVPA